MSILIWISIFTVISILILHFILKSIKRAIFITFTIIFVFSLVLVVVIISDAKNLENLQTSNSLFIYQRGEMYNSAVSINFVSSEPIPFTEEELSTLNENMSILSDKDFFKIFTFSDQSIELLLSENITPSEGINFTKDEILKILHSTNQEEIDQSFTIVILNILNNLQDKDKLAVFLNEYKENRISISPPIKAISVLSLLPKKLVDSVLSRV